MRTRTHWRAHALLLLVLVAMIYPMVWLVGASFKPENQIFTTMNPLPLGFTIANYRSNDQFGIVERGATCVRQNVSQFSAFKN